MAIQFKKDFLRNYLKEAPLPLALERSLECEILSQQNFTKPILDIGCGEGMFAHILFSEKIDVGIDPNASELKRAKEYNGYQELICCTGDQVSKEDATFNTIFSNSVIEHIEALNPVLSEASRLLKKEGSLYVTVPTNLFEEYTFLNQLLCFFHLTTLAKRFRRFFNNFWKHYHCYNKANWETIFLKQGFKVVQSIEYGSKKFCVLNDFISPFCALSFVTKKLTNKWFAFPLLESFISKVKYFIFHKMISPDEINVKQGGLIFFELRKDV